LLLSAGATLRGRDQNQRDKILRLVRSANLSKFEPMSEIDRMIRETLAS
jgi:hypothetical protein